MSKLMTQWTDAYRKTLEDYQNNSHKITQYSCHKCQLAEDEDANPNRGLFETDCNKCPEIGITGKASLSCLNRKCRILQLPREENFTHEVAAVIEYHKIAVEMMEKRKNFNLKQIGKKLKEIDEQTFKKYGEGFFKRY